MSNDASIYVWGCFAISMALPAIEIALLRVRSRLIRRHLGWGRRYTETAPPQSAVSSASALADGNGTPSGPRPATGARRQPVDADLG